MVKTRYCLGRGQSTPYFYFDTYAEAIDFLCSDALKGYPTDGWAIVQQNIVYSDTSL